LKDQHFEVEQGTCKGQGTSPLSSPGLGGEAFHPRLGAEEGLRNRSVGLVAPRRAHTFVLVEDFCGRLQYLFEAMSAHQGRWTPEPVDFPNRLGYLDLTLGGHFLKNEVHRKQWSKIRRSDRLQSAGMKYCGKRHREVRLDVVPGARHACLIEKILGRGCHRVASCPGTTRVVPDQYRV